MKTGGLHGAIFDSETGEVELYAPDKQVLFESGAVGDEPQDQKLKIAESFLDAINQVEYLAHPFIFYKTDLPCDFPLLENYKAKIL